MVNYVRMSSLLRVLTVFTRFAPTLIWRPMASAHLVYCCCIALDMELLDAGLRQKPNNSLSLLITSFN